jgi:hypothetical protein
MKEVLKAELPRYLAIMAGTALGKMWWRGEHHEKPAAGLAYREGNRRRRYYRFLYLLPDHLDSV